jgi:hypothetical protein
MNLVRQSYQLLMQDKELMVLPLISGVIVAAVISAMFFGFGIDPGQVRRNDPATIAGMFLLYVVTYAIGIFFQAAVIAGATERMRGGDPTVGSALGAAWHRVGAIVMWSVVAATVGVLLRIIHDRVGFLGKIITSIVGAAWSFATFFIVPVLVLEERSVAESFTQSMATFKKTWGETMVGGMSLGIAAMVGWVTLVAIVGLLGWAGAGIIVSLAVFAAGAVTLVVFFSALQGIYVASLYRFATEGRAPSGFDPDLLAHAFVPKTR